MEKCIFDQFDHFLAFFKDCIQADQIIALTRDNMQETEQQKTINKLTGKNFKIERDSLLKEIKNELQKNDHDNTNLKKCTYKKFRKAIKYTMYDLFRTKVN